MEIKKVVAELFQEEKETRGSHPSIFDCSDDNRYVVKHSQQGRNYLHLINELIAAQLAAAVNIPNPSFALVEIKQSILPNDYKFACGKPSGLGFGSQFLPGIIKSITNIDNLISITKTKNYEIVEDFVKICAFDIWVKNTDRVVNNPNLLLQETGNRIRLFAIDHSSIFSELSYLSLEKEVDELPAIGENLIEKELFSHLYFKYGLFFNKIKQDICAKISTLDDSIIMNAVVNVPSEWKLSDDEKEAIFIFLNKRKSIVENHFNYLLKEIGL